MKKRVPFQPFENCTPTFIPEPANPMGVRQAGGCLEKPGQTGAGDLYSCLTGIDACLIACGFSGSYSRERNPEFRKLVSTLQYPGETLGNSGFALVPMSNAKTLDNSDQR